MSNPRDSLSQTSTMGKKAPKSTRKFAAKGQLKKTIKTRQKRQQLRKKIQSRGTAKPTLQKADVDSDESGERKKYVFLARYQSNAQLAVRTRVNTVDELLNAGFMDEESEDVRR